MEYVISSIMIVDAVFALYVAFKYAFSKYERSGYFYLFIIMCVASAVWSGGFSVMTVSGDEHMAYIFRSIGIAGTFAYLITGKFLLWTISEVKSRISKILNALSFVGIAVYILTIQPGQTSYRKTVVGMTYSFTPGIVNIIYNAYFIIISMEMLMLIVNMIFFSKLKRIKSFGKKFVMVEIFVLIGTVFDMLFPAMGLPAIPGSSITQFWGVLVIWYAVRKINESSITKENMTTYIYDSLASPVLIFDGDGVLSLANDAALTKLDIKEETVARKLLRVGSCFSNLPQNLYNFDGITTAVDARCKSDDSPCSISVSRILDEFEDCIGYIMVVTDMTDYYNALNDAEEAKREADAANTAKTLFLANMSHEIRTPMNAIMSFSELALQGELNEEAKSNIANIKSASFSLLGIINDILDISKIESGKVELIVENYRTAELFEGIFKLIQVQADDKGLALNLEQISPVPVELAGDATRIREILINILNNSVKYTRTGSINLKLGSEDIGDDLVNLKFIVSDTGIGIKPEAIPNLFDAFSRADLKKNVGIEGTGLGLAIVKNYVDMMGGSIDVESTYGQGTTFTVVIPQKKINGAPMKMYIEKTKSSKTDSFSLGSDYYDNVPVLVVDDNSVNRLVISKTLKHYGLNVDLASGGKEAIEKCRGNVYRIVFMDQMMPEMDGVEAMQILRKDIPQYASGSENRIVALTANAIRGVREELIGLGFDDYLEKPMNFKEVERVLRTFIG